MIAPIVSLEEWQRRRTTSVTADVRWYLDGRSGRDAYAAGHLPGAVWVDLDAWLAGPPSAAAGRHPLPDPAHFAAGLSELGIGDDSTVLAYDDAGGVVAARLVWLLRATGRDAALIDGGILAYDGPLDTEPTHLAPATLTPRPWPTEALADVESALDPRTVLLDARDPERYLGQLEPVDPRPGHIPGARNLPVRSLTGEDGRLLSADALRERFAGAGVDVHADVVASCGSGVTACHALLVQEHLGLGAGRLYPGSYSQYSHTSRPVALGSG